MDPVRLDTLRAVREEPLIFPLLGALAFAAPTCTGAPGDPAGWGCRREFAGHVVLDLHGDDAAIGRTYGELLATELTDAYLPMMRQMIGDVPAPFWSALMAHDAHLPGFFSPEMGERAAALEAKLGLPAGEVRRYAWLSELGSIGPAVQVATSGIVQIDGVTGKPIGGCTSFIGQGPGGTLHARNVDFWGMGFWQKYATIVFVEPLTPRGEPDGYRYAQVSDVGEVFAGTTGINEPGLVVTTHLHLARDVTLVDGRLHRSALGLLLHARFGPKDQPQVSVLRVVETLLRRAASVRDAVWLLAGLRTAGAWSFVLSDRSGDSAVVGMNSRHVAVTGGATLQTNFYPDAGMRSRELIPARGPVEGAQLRYARARALIDAEPLTVPRAIAILRDRLDLATGYDRFASPNSVLSPDATQSIVFETPKVGPSTLWIATPHPDGLTPSALADLVAVPFDAGFDASRCPDGCVRQSLPYTPGPMDAAVTTYAAAIHQLVDEHDPAAALLLLRSIPGDDPGVHLVAAWLAASLGDFTAANAELALTRASTRPLSHHHQALAAFLEGTLAREAGDEPAATRAFTAALALVEGPDPLPGGLDRLLLPAIRARLAHPNARRPLLPAPDLKFQDVFGLR